MRVENESRKYANSFLFLSGQLIDTTQSWEIKKKKSDEHISSVILVATRRIWNINK